MVNILLNYYNFDGDWAKKRVGEYIGGGRVTVLPVFFRDRDVWDEQSFLKLYGKNGEKYENIVRPFSSFGITGKDIQWVDIYKDAPEEVKEKIIGSDVLLLTGGLPDRGLKRIYDYKIDDALKDYCGTLIGVSAGAMVQLDRYHITPDTDYSSYELQRGLGLLKDFDLEVHYADESLQKRCAMRAAKELSCTVYAVRHEGGIICENGEILPFGSYEIFRG